jgi:hypothetical protein
MNVCIAEFGTLPDELAIEGRMRNARRGRVGAGVRHASVFALSPFSPPTDRVEGTASTKSSSAIGRRFHRVLRFPWLGSLDRARGMIGGGRHAMNGIGRERGLPIRARAHRDPVREGQVGGNPGRLGTPVSRLRTPSADLRHPRRRDPETPRIHLQDPEDRLPADGRCLRGVLVLHLCAATLRRHRRGQPTALEAVVVS